MADNDKKKLKLLEKIKLQREKFQRFKEERLDTLVKKIDKKIEKIRPKVQDVSKKLEKQLKKSIAVNKPGKVKKKEIKQFRQPVEFPSFVGAKLMNANSRAMNEQQGLDKPGVRTQADQPMIPDFDFPTFGSPDFQLIRGRNSIINTSNGIIPEFGSPRINLPVFEMPNFSPSPTIAERRNKKIK